MRQPSDLETLKDAGLLRSARKDDQVIYILNHYICQALVFYEKIQGDFIQQTLQITWVKQHYGRRSRRIQAQCRDYLNQ